VAVTRQGLELRLSTPSLETSLSDQIPSFFLDPSSGSFVRSLLIKTECTFLLSQYPDYSSVPDLTTTWRAQVAKLWSRDMLTNSISLLFMCLCFQTILIFA
jgi:hypothetical protein